MARDFSEVLQQAMEFYVAGQLVEARALLLDLVRADSKLEAGWMFLSYTLEDPSQKADCLRKVLALNPNNAEAKTELTKLESVLHEGPKAPPSTSELLKIAPAAAPAPAPGGELPHASPFTMDIDHANDDIAFMAEARDRCLSSRAGRFPPDDPRPDAGVETGTHCSETSATRKTCDIPRSNTCAARATGCRGIANNRKKGNAGTHPAQLPGNAGG
jgi:hypothetical protein